MTYTNINTTTHKATLSIRALLMKGRGLDGSSRMAFSSSRPASSTLPCLFNVVVRVGWFRKGVVSLCEVRGCGDTHAYEFTHTHPHTLHTHVQSPV